MLRDPSLGVDAKENLTIIGRSGEHLLGLINDVLDMSKIEAGRAELNPVIFNLPRLLEDLAAMFRLRAETKSLPDNAYRPRGPREEYRPMVPAESAIPEATGRSVAWGLFLCVLFTIASAYCAL